METSQTEAASTVLLDEVDALIAELETQFGDAQMLPQAAYPCVTCPQYCTLVASCAC